MKKLMTLLSVLTIVFGSVSYGATIQTAQENENKSVISQEQTKSSQDIQWEKAHAYAHYRSETR